ncbi:Trafficking particle complex subunit 11 [Cordyceps militaris]|uniref:Trafficking particle complex subunit 11 n=1 Tax=Cordyceps militaris TaxID=73501 RepID=A0A2H4S736_CORMI|nr:Trafficking particle complex subunit 11 [Cordyceps militaris]
MDGYPLGSLDHNVPLLIFSGLTSTSSEIELDANRGGEVALLRSDLPPLNSKEAELLAQHFENVDNEGQSWRAVSREEPYRLRIKTVGRTYALPPKRASLPKDAEPTRPNPILRSPFSPLSPASTLYPDGLMNAQWIQKHQEVVPSVFACCYCLTNDPASATLEDNRIKTDINKIKAALTEIGHKTRLAVIFVQREGDGSSPSITDQISERLETIRKGTAMDPKAIFYIHPQDSPTDLKQVADSILASLYGTAIEYYRDLGRHARKKRSRGIVPQPTVPPTSGTSQTLSMPDWNFRYDFKTAIFSEFRQEFDPAIRSFEQSYEILLGQDVMDTIPSWSPRWNEARLLADIISIRCLRLHLWMNQPSLAVRRWQAHRDRIGDLVDRRGKGTNNYGWQAWEARWALAMAQLTERVELPGLAPSSMNLYLQPEKAVLGERLHPWELLHHTGYWYRIAARHISARRTLALMIPEEDRAPPNESKTKDSQHYDTYLCPPPYKENPIQGDGVNHAQLMIDCLIAARTQFQGRKQLRLAAELSLECAREMAKLEDWQDVLAMLRPLWEDLSFRSENWVDISEELCWLMRQAAVASGRGELVVAIDWELINKKFTKRPHWHYDLSKCLDGMKLEVKPSVDVSDGSATGFISTSFVFRNKESRAGDFCQAQLSLASNAMPGSAPVTLSNVRVEFEGSLKPITLEHAPSDEKGAGCPVSIRLVTLDEEFLDDSNDDLPTKLNGSCDLTLQAGQRVVIEMAIPLREAGDVEPSTVTLNMNTKTFDLTSNLPFRDTDAAVGWFIPGSSKPRKVRADSRMLTIQPRPPKLDIKIARQLQQYYANEPIALNVVLENNEDEAATTKLDIHVLGKLIPILHVGAGGKDYATETRVEEEAELTGINLGKIESSASQEIVLGIEPIDGPMTYELQLRATYHLETDSATPIIQVSTVQLNLVNAFEANYDLVPRLHPDPWPSLFDPEGLDDIHEEDGKQRRPIGLIQRWCLLSHYASFAQEDVRVLDTEVEVTETVGSARSVVRKMTEITEPDGLLVEPKTMHEAQFEIEAQKMQLEDRSPVSIDLAFKIKWRRADAAPESPANTTTLPVGRYLVLGSEPRVLATTFHGEPDETSTIQLDISIENPSNHLLTFGLTMDPSDEFAFSGAKQTTLHMLPMSRRTATYRLLPYQRGCYIRPGLVVRDKYFQKVLRIIPTEGMKIDKDGLLVWVPGLEEGEEGEAGEEAAQV